MLTLTNADIIARMSQLAHTKGKAISGTTTTLVDNVTFDANRIKNDAFNNWYICFLSGSNKGVDRIITDFDNTTSTFTFDALTNAIDNTSVYAIVPVGFLQYQEESYSYIVERVRNIGKELDLFLTESQLKELHLYKTLDLICQDLFQDATDEDLYYSRHIYYRDTFENTFMGLRADYDENEDGVISEDEKAQGGSFGVLRR